jgi:hypothetical protein
MTHDPPGSVSMRLISLTCLGASPQRGSRFGAFESIVANKLRLCDSVIDIDYFVSGLVCLPWQSHVVKSLTHRSAHGQGHSLSSLPAYSLLHLINNRKLGLSIQEQPPTWPFRLLRLTLWLKDLKQPLRGAEIIHAETVQAHDKATSVLVRSWI